MQHRNNFDGLRLLGAGMVLVSHQYAVLGLDEPRLGGNTLGRTGVMLFFAISGYLIAQSWRRDPQPFRFATRRFLRIAPALAVLQLLTMSLLTVLGISTFDRNPLPAVNGSLWTIPLEIECYLVFLAIALIMRRVGIAMIGLFLLGWTTGAFAYLPWIDGQLTFFGIAFGFGVLLHEHSWLRRPVAAAAMVVLAVLAWRLSIPSFGVAMLAAAAAIQIGERSWPGWRDAGRYGDLSYGLYLYAFPVQQLLVMWLGPHRPYPLMLTLTLLASLALAWLSWHIIERPALSLKPKPAQPDIANGGGRLRTAADEAASNSPG